MKKKAIKITICLLAFIAIFNLAFARSVELKYNFTPGKTYVYELSTSSSSTCNSFRVNLNQEKQASSKVFELKVIDFQNNSFVIDIKSDDRIIRRYIRPDGKLMGAPSESGKQTPFFISFPQGAWQINQEHVENRVFALGNSQAKWTSTITNLRDNVAQIAFNASLSLPSDRDRQKQASISGNADFNLTQGLIQQAQWAINYSFSFTNREFAVSRNVYSFHKQIFCVLQLIDIKD